MKAVSRTTRGEIEEIVSQLRLSGNAEPKNYLLLPEREIKNWIFVLNLLSQMEVPWLSGERVRVCLMNEPKGEDRSGSVEVVECEGESDFMLAPVPRIQMKNQKQANRYQPDRWFKKRPKLAELAYNQHPRDPEDYLVTLLNQAGKVNVPFDWIQELPKTRRQSCRAKFRPVVDIYGGVVGLRSETHYFVMACGSCEDEFQVFT